jgi:hypothetical protein
VAVGEPGRSVHQGTSLRTLQIQEEREEENRPEEQDVQEPGVSRVELGPRALRQKASNDRSDIEEPKPEVPVRLVKARLPKTVQVEHGRHQNDQAGHERQEKPGQALSCEC